MGVSLSMRIAPAGRQRASACSAAATSKFSLSFAPAPPSTRTMVALPATASLPASARRQGLGRLRDRGDHQRFGSLDRRQSHTAQAPGAARSSPTGPPAGLRRRIATARRSSSPAKCAFRFRRAAAAHSLRPPPQRPDRAFARLPPRPSRLRAPARSRARSARPDRDASPTSTRCRRQR